MISQKALARRLELSQATISRSLRNDERINPDTRARVLEAASRLGYAGLSRRRAVKPGDVATVTQIGVLVQNSAATASYGHTVVRLLAGMTEAAQRLGVSIHIHHVPYEDRANLASADRQPPALRHGLIKGLILLRRFEPATVSALARGTACVSVVHDYLDLGVDYVGPDEATDIGRVVEMVLGRGHRRVAYVGGPVEFSWARRRRFAFLESWAQVAGGERPQIWETQDEVRRLETADLRKLLDGGATALVCAGDTLAYRACSLLQKMGVMPGKQITVTGYDGHVPPEGLAQAATLRQPFEEMGQVALERLLERLRYPTQALRRVLLASQWIEGQTLAAPVGASG